MEEEANNQIDGQNYDQNLNKTTTTMATIQNKLQSQQQKKDDQFKATKMWNEVLHAFYLGIELKKHRNKMKSHYDCFTTSEAVTWLKNHLKNNKNFNENKITRTQALNLLKKYHRSNIVEKINLNKNDLELKDNNELLRFTMDANENLPFIRTSKSDEDLLKSYTNDDNYEILDLDIREKQDIYKRVLWSYLSKILYNINDYIQLEKINSQTLFNNCTKINSNGVVQLLDKNEDLPHWILSAMKCLANWPKASGSGNCLPKYPGFEYDVFKLIREYFTNMEEPIIGYNFYKLFIDVHELYVKALSTSRTKLAESKLNFQSPKITTISSSTFNNNHEQELGLPPNCVYETVFSTKDPVTKIVPIDELSNVCPSLVEYFKRTTTLMNEANVLNRKINECKYPPLSLNSSKMTSNTFQALSTIPRRNCKKKQPLPSSSTTTTIMNNVTPKQKSNDETFTFESPPETGEYMLSKNVSFKKFYSLRKNNNNNNLKPSGSCSNKNGFDSQIESLVNLKNQYYELIQLCLLLLPNSNRRHLQLLIRLFYKIIGNKELCLLTKDSLELKEHIVTIFTRCIICAEKEIDYNEFRAKEFVSFLIDECMEIFKIPTNFSNDVDKMITETRKKKNDSQENNYNNNDYCQKISNEQYELQRDVLSDMELNDLLQSIMNDDSLSERDKLKWIKQFKMYHPDVYDIYFTNCNKNNLPNGNNNNNSLPTLKQQQRAYSLGSNKIISIKQKRDLFKRFLSLKV